MATHKDTPQATDRHRDPTTEDSEQPTSRDQLVTRPDEPLPTVEDPSGAHAKGFPADPKPDPAARPPDDDLARSV